MISVQFTMSTNDEPIDYLKRFKEPMPWLDYLVEHSTEITCELDYYNLATYIKYVTINFVLDEKYETFYRLKYSSYH
jgi:hypothetical protein